ncbi:MAG: SGNH/GDSL hydrolase family protein [Xanthobacteraceae bacterium]
MDASNSSTPHGAALPRTPLGVRPQRALGNGKSVDTPRIMRLRKLVLFSGQAFIILCITFALAEVALRIYNSIKPLPIFYSTSYNRFRGKPFSSDYDSFHLNSRGFKDVEHNAQKAAGTFRILGIGDSFAFGVVPYTNNWLTLLKDKLNRNGKHVELINMGIPGTDPADYLSLFIHEGLELKPDMVLLSFFMGNDFDERSRSLLSYSYAATAIKFVIDVNTKFEGRIWHGNAKYDDNANSVTDAQYLKLESAVSSIFLKNNKRFERDFTDAWSHVREINQICARLGIRFLVVVIPDELQVNDQLQQRVIDARRLPPESFDFGLPNNMLIAKFRESNIDYIDLRDDFASISKSMRLYKPNDTHWNISGNRTASEIIAKHMMATWE